MEYIYKRNLYKGYGITIDSFMSIPAISNTSKKQNTASLLLSSYPMIIISKDYVKYDPSVSLKSNRFIVSVKNHFKVLNLLDTAVNWFSDESIYNNVYFIEETTGEVSIDIGTASKYTKTMIDDTSKNTQGLKIVPNLAVDVTTSKKEPAMLLFINTIDNAFAIPKNDVCILHYIFFEWSYQTEIDIAMNALHCYLTKTNNYDPRIGNGVVIEETKSIFAK